TAVWSDDELVEPETPAYVRAAAGALGARLVIVEGWARHADWFLPWRETPYWRESEPDMLRIGRRSEPWAWAAGYGGALVGLRAEESRQRRLHLAARGPLYGTA